MKRIATLMILLIALALPAAAQEYADGIYRGFYYDGGIEQITFNSNSRMENSIRWCIAA